MVALERAEMGAGIDPFGPAILLPALARIYT
jgi:hypothetical protein